MPKYCPKCGHSFPEDWEECNECEVELIYEKEDRVLYTSNVHYIDIQPYQPNIEKNVPKCPTCSSTNIEKISGADKVMGAVVFGIFSKTAKSQFKCKNCGYKW